MNPLKALSAGAVGYLAMPGGMVYRVRRVRTADLVQVGFAELAGQAEVRSVLKDVQETLRRAEVDEGALSDEEVEKIRRNREHDERAALERFEAVMGESAKRQQAWADRTDAFVCAGVTGLGWLRDGLSIEGENGTENGTENGASVPVFTEVARDQVRDLTDVRFVRRESEADPDPEGGVLWVGIIHSVHRQILHGQISKMNGVKAAARPFHIQSGLST